jgi:hypothetical protein
MKKYILTLFFTLLAFGVLSQANLVTISGGWAFVNVDASDVLEDDPNVKTSGWRINGLYEYNPNEGQFAYGAAIGYVSVKANDASGLDTVEYKVSTLPVYFAPKYMFGSNRTKGFIKLAIGVQSSNLKRTGPSGTLEGKDFGFYGGGGAGLMLFVYEKVFFDVEYEIAYMTNAYYRNGLLQSVMVGLGVKL